MELVISKLLPLVILLFIGGFLQKSKHITPDIINGLKFIILKIALPAVLFFAFSHVKLELNYTLLFILIFLYCCVLFAIGYLFKKKIHYQYLAEYFTGFEFGMLGVALFTSIWGMENLPIIALIALGHELFIWFVYAPLLEYKNAHKITFLQSFTSFLKSPIIIAIILGILVNLFGIFDTIESTLVGKSIFEALTKLSAITIPLILMVVGYSIRIRETKLLESFKLIAIRFATVMLVGTGLYYVITLLIGNIDPIFFKAFFAFILLPPPYILPIMMKKDSTEILFFSNTIILYTLWSFICFIGLVLI